MNLFWGCALILAGLTIIINILFGINLPIIKVIFAALLIYWGFKLLMPSESYCYSYSSSCNSYTASSSTDDKEKYYISFSSSIVDLRHLTEHTAPETIHIDVRFANAVVLLPKNVPLRVKANVQFASVNLPNNTLSSEYVNLHGALEPALTIYINSRFANVVVKE